MLGWSSLFKMLQEANSVWGEAQAELDKAVKGNRGNSGERNADGTFAKSAHRAEKDPTVDSYGKPKDRKSRLVRTLTNLKDNPDACKEKGTTPEKVANPMKSNATVWRMIQP